MYNKNTFIYQVNIMFGGYYLKERLGNNIFCFDENKPLWITKMLEGNILNAKKGKKSVFREKNKNIFTESLSSQEGYKILGGGQNLGKCEDFVGLENCILQKRTLGTGKSQFVFLIDNHNYALWCWNYAIEKGIIGKGTKLLHIDQHSDMNNNNELKKTSKKDFFERFVVENTTIASFIKPAIRLGIISDVELVLSEYKLFEIGKKIQKKCFFIENGILDIDLDFWDKRAGYKSFNKHKYIISSLINLYPVITIATSPYFIEQDYALELLNWLFEDII